MLPYIGCVAAIIVLIIQQYAQAKRLDELTAELDDLRDLVLPLER